MTDAEGSLRPFTSQEAALVAEFPLPDRARDGVLNKSQLAAALDTSETTISQWLRRGVPVEEAGTNGRSYAFRLSLVWAWVAKRDAEENANRRHGDTVAAQMQLALLGGESAGGGADGKMTLAEQRKALELEMLRTTAARDRGDLIRRADVVALLEDIGAAMRDASDALPDRLARECGLTPAQVEAAVAGCDDIMRGVVAAMEGILGHDGGSD